MTEQTVEPKVGWVYVDDPKVAHLIELFKRVDSGVLLVTIHKKRLVKVQPLSKQNLLDVIRDQHPAQPVH